MARIRLRPDRTALLLRASETVLSRRPDLALRVVRVGVRRSAHRPDGEPLTARLVVAWLAGRLVDDHPAAARMLLRLALRRAARRHTARARVRNR